jgi:hypothetical protein
MRFFFVGGGGGVGVEGTVYMCDLIIHDYFSIWLNSITHLTKHINIFFLKVIHIDRKLNHYMQKL